LNKHATMNNKTALIILDGWGIGKQDNSDAIFNANTPFMDGLMANYPSTQLLTHGTNVGLPDGQMGNSEVGHLNIGAGRIVYQDFAKINKAIADGEMPSNQALLAAIAHVKQHNSQLHFIGLLSEGGVHSHQNHLTALCQIAHDHGITNSYVHAFTDGRDCDPKSGLNFMQQFEKSIKNTPTKVASIIGRYYAMDRDKRWERVKQAYDLLVKGNGTKFTSATEAISASYTDNNTDEFIEPSIITAVNGNPLTTIKANDAVICFNFRTDRCREITEVLTQQAFPKLNMTPLDVHYTTMTNYDRTFNNVHVMFDKDNLQMTLGETIAKAGLTQVRIAETEKYPHVTFFFSGGREEPFTGETRLMVNSPKVATYDLQPEMSAPEVASSICTHMENNQPDFVCLNFANPDMVGHTGVYDAIIKAVETTDNCAKQVVETGLKLGYNLIIIADHGNADVAVNQDGSPNTAHSTNPVPAVVITNRKIELQNGILADVAPTILDLMDVGQPIEMTGKSLIKK
jgi:2,3-bisphosphoglycerate-independent phosphoglycerate mutase